ncbi:MBL fold metallo-hydrolase [Phycicoccus sp. 3266]|uniref:MBL fold metallo-hydrolase n=1 Tax=Phycicoccus sp. 3266 TaxID=2817751 RepID=UPI002865E87B|nr:MBL fold metallo-hydrolase [Phycicoccus sp. 3266]MDR6864701.1 glyoxylase-like metal-dependent hydrolase (beta-lactamase superfamily II)/rhodanese-related sulfurtransferase [Phycicoccus sp. 3266]
MNTDTTVSTPVIVPIDTPTLGDRSYLAHDGSVAVVVDPQRDIDRVLALAAEAGVTITHVFETHIHNDYVTGGLALARATGAAYHVNAADDVSYDRTPISDGDLVEVSPTLRVRAIATPGHTYTHLSYALESAAAPGEVFDPVGVFTGGSLLFGATGRPDLLGHDHTDALVHHQFASAHRLADELPEHTHVLPTHGFGSFCSAGSTGDTTASTIGAEKRQNPALTQAEEKWVADTLAGLDAYPAYYVHMGPANSSGPGAPDLDAPATADKETLAARIRAGEWVVDLRTRTAFAAGHVTGTLNFGLDGQFATYLGWLIPRGTPLTLLGDSPEQVAEAQRELVRIGIDRLEGAATGTPEDWTDEELGSFERAVFADLAQVRHHRRVQVLDVRRVNEFDEGHIEGAVNIPLHELLERLDEVPAGEVWVHCAGGYRASIAASVLAARKVPVVAVDDSFGENAAAAGLPMASAA